MGRATAEAQGGSRTECFPGRLRRHLLGGRGSGSRDGPAPQGGAGRRGGEAAAAAERAERAGLPTSEGGAAQGRRTVPEQSGVGPQQGQGDRRCPDSSAGDDGRHADHQRWCFVIRSGEGGSDHGCCSRLRSIQEVLVTQTY